MVDKDLKHQKRELRNSLKARRMLLDVGYCKESDAEILRFLKELECYREAKVIFSYVSMPGEVDTKRFIKEALAEGKRIAVPRCEPKGIMEAYEITGLDDLEPGVWGIGEPKQQCPGILPEDIDLCVIPCIASTSAGVRLGYGGGYYDRYLPRTDAVRVLLCRDQMICEEIPQEIHDCQMDVVITERRIIRNHKE